jgi:tyrosine-protein kinase Etk/Wzc
MSEDGVLNNHESSAHTKPDSRAASEEREIDLIGVATLLLREKKSILKFVLVAAILSAILTYVVMRPMYTAQATFIPPQNAPGSGLSQLAGQLGSLSAMGSLGGLKTSGDVYLGILGSRTIADDLIERFDLEKVYRTKRVSDIEKKLKARSTFTSGKDTLITISVDDHDPKRAADLANAYMDALHDQNGRLALTDASQRRLFFEQQLEREKNSLADAEVELKKTQEQTGLIVPNGQAQVQIETMAQTRAQITSLQVELAAMKQGATDENPQVVLLQTQISGLQQQLQMLQNDPAKRLPGNIQVSASKVPEYALEYIRKQREVKYHEVLFELIAKQYESARLDESRQSPLLQVVDRAVVPDKKSGPLSGLIIFASCLLGAFVGAIWVISKKFLDTVKKDPVNATKYEDLRQAASPWH